MPAGRWGEFHAGWVEQKCLMTASLVASTDIMRGRVERG